MDEQLECDLVMKGGITSGVVYPPATLPRKERYRFRNTGGASVGETDPLTGTLTTGLRESFADYRDRLATGEVDAEYLWGRDAAWCAAAAEQTDDLLRLADRWIGPPEGGGPQDVDPFDGDDPPSPRGVMRIVPPV
ncbi:MAG: hypothetical protein ACXWXQ_07895 [Actinomycetota bacterium]